MAREKRSVPGYERLTASGAVRQRFAGVEARIKDGDDPNGKSATWFIKADTIGGLTPRAGDVCWGTDGVTRTVTSVGELTSGGEWPCVLEPETDET